MDEISPRRPQDPPWRVRIAHRSSDPYAMEVLRRARERRGWTMTRAAAETGVSRPMISQLERGQRRPSVSLAEALIAGYGMTGPGADAVRAIALDWVGRDSPYRTGVSPPWPDPDPDPSWDTQGDGTHRGGSAVRRWDGQGNTADDGRARATRRPVVDAAQWIEWARKKAEAAQSTRRTPGTS